MTNLLDRFKKTSVGSFNRDVSYYDKILPSSELDRHEGISAIIISWRNILRTPEETYDHDPEYGTKLSRFIFDPSDPITKEKILDEVKSKLMRYDDRARIGKIKILQHNNKKGFTLDITIKYRGEERDFTVDIDDTLVG